MIGPKCHRDYIYFLLIWPFCNLSRFSELIFLTNVIFLFNLRICQVLHFYYFMKDVRNFQSKCGYIKTSLEHCYIPDFKVLSSKCPQKIVSAVAFTVAQYYLCSWRKSQNFYNATVYKYLILIFTFRDHQGHFWNLQDLSFSKLSLLLNFDTVKAEIFKVKDTRGLLHFYYFIL